MSTIGTLRILAADICDAASMLLNPQAADDAETLDDIDAHTNTTMFLVEDIRDTLTRLTVAAPGTASSDAAATSPASSATGAGHLTPNRLRVAARGLREWIDGETCIAPTYWRSIADSLDFDVR